MAIRTATTGDTTNTIYTNWIDTNIVPMHGTGATMQVGDVIYDRSSDSYQRFDWHYSFWMYGEYTTQSGNTSGNTNFAVTTTISDMPSTGSFENFYGVEGDIPTLGDTATTFQYTGGVLEDLWTMNDNSMNQNDWVIFTTVGGGATEYVTNRRYFVQNEVGDTTFQFTGGTIDDLWTLAGHNLVNDDVVRFTEVGTGTGTGYTQSTKYYVINVTGDSFQLSATQGGSAITGDSDSSGTWTLQYVHIFQLSDSFNGSAIAGTSDSTGTWILQDFSEEIDVYKYSAYTGSEFYLDTTEHPTGLVRDYILYTNCESVYTYCVRFRQGATMWFDGEELGCDLSSGSTYVQFRILRSDGFVNPYLSTFENPFTIRPLRKQVIFIGDMLSISAIDHVVFDGECVAYPGLRQDNPWENDSFLHGQFGLIGFDYDDSGTHCFLWQPNRYVENPSVRAYGCEAIGAFSGFRFMQGATAGTGVNVRLAEIKRCYRHDAEGGEGLYWGNTGSDPQPLFNQVIVEDCIFARCAAESIQVQEQVGLAYESVYRNNVIIGGAADWISPFQGAQGNLFQLVFGDGNRIIKNNLCGGSSDSGIIQFGTTLGTGQGRIQYIDNYFFDHENWMYIHNSGLTLDELIIEWQRMYYGRLSTRYNRKLGLSAPTSSISSNNGDIQFKFKNVFKDSSTPSTLYGDNSGFEIIEGGDYDAPEPEFINVGLKYDAVTGDTFDYLGIFANNLYAGDTGVRHITSIVNNGSGIARVTVNGSHYLTTGETVFITNTTNYNGSYPNSAIRVDNDTIDISGLTYVGDEGTTNYAFWTPPTYYKDEIVGVKNGTQNMLFLKCIADPSIEPTGATYNPSADTANWEQIYWDVNGVRSDATGYTGTPDPRTRGLFPPDDVRLVDGSFWNERNVGLSLNPTSREKYQWQLSEDNATWRDIPDVSAKQQKYNEGISGKYYRCKITISGVDYYSPSTLKS